MLLEVGAGHRHAKTRAQASPKGAFGGAAWVKADWPMASGTFGCRLRLWRIYPREPHGIRLRVRAGARPAGFRESGVRMCSSDGLYMSSCSTRSDERNRLGIEGRLPRMAVLSMIRRPDLGESQAPSSMRIWYIPQTLFAQHNAVLSIAGAVRDQK